MGQKEIIDDVYFKAGDVVKTDKSSTAKKPKIDKNGAKEIIFTTNDSSYVASQDTTYLVAEANDSTETDQGYYLNGFNGTESDMEYADRIRKFHDPRFRVFVGDPNYNDIYLLNDWDWNVYVDGSYAYVTPTWTNPYWFDYMYSPYTFGYNGWYWRNSLYNPYYYGSYYSPYYYGYGYGYGNYYGYGWNNPYYGGYYSWWNHSYYNNYNVRNRSDYRNQNENPRWADSNSRNPMANSVSARSVAGASTVAGSRVGYNSSNPRNSYTTLSNDNRVFRNTSGTRVLNGNNANSSRSAYTNSLLENRFTRGNMEENPPRQPNSVSTRPRTIYSGNTNSNYTTNNNYRNNNTNNTNSNSRRSSYSVPRTSYSTGAPTSRSSSSSNSYQTTRSSSYSSPSSDYRSSGSYSNSSSSGNSRQSSSSSSGSSSRSSSSNGGRR